MGLDYQNELFSERRYEQILADFHSFYYLRINQRRQEHLASLGLQLRRKTVWEVSAGIGDHTSFFLDRECTVLSTEVRPELLEILSRRYPKISVQHLNLEEPDNSFPSGFDITYCYGVLYHVRTPAAALKFLSERCTGILLLETCVSFGSDLLENVVEEYKDCFSQALSGQGCRPTRNWVFHQLRQHFEYVYIPLTQPNHEQFPIDWTKPASNTPFTRAIFLGSREPIENDLLSSELVLRQRYY